MCGIAGMLKMRFDEGIISDLLSTMRRRGPDAIDYYASGNCCLMHSRLAIIDPDGGGQPMHLVWAGETYTIVYNGELYNTDELRKVLIRLGHSFVGHSDTEVVLHAYAQWSEACLLKFNGIFAFAVLESKRKKLFLARDRIGVKPLFYKQHGDGLIFASEIKTILAHPDVEAKLDAVGASQLLLLGPGRIPGSGILRDIKEVEPGCFGYFTYGKWNWKRYWKLCDREHTDSFEDTAEKVRYLVTDSIERQMVSDVPIGTFLSGGLDSSLISSVCARKMQHVGSVLPTFSLDYRNNDKYFVANKFQPNSDTQYIRIMQQHLDSDHQWTVLTPEELVGALDASTEARDLPGMADVDFSLLLFCEQIRKRVKVALSGECADEIFGGYPWYRDPEIRARDGFPWSQNVDERSSFLTDHIKKQINPIEFVRDQYDATVRQSDILPESSPLEKRMKEMMNLNFRWFMQTLLDRKDRMSMYHGLEVRVPFCDYRIAEYMYSVPWEYKDYNGQEKGLLRYAMRDYLPEPVLYRKKSPYPKTFDPNYTKLVSGMLKELMRQKDAPIFQIVQRSALENLQESNYLWPWYGQLMRVPQTIAYMLQINRWMEMYHISYE